MFDIVGANKHRADPEVLLPQIRWAGVRDAAPAWKAAMEA
jgi:hypothetical protein